jgi:hypothetical protein
LLKARVDFSRPAAFQRVASHIQEIALLLALGARLRRHGGGDEESAMTAFPVRQAAFRADVAGEFARRGKTAMVALISVWLVFHSPHLNLFCSLPAYFSALNLEPKLSNTKWLVNHLSTLQLPLQGEQRSQIGSIFSCGP